MTGAVLPDTTISPASYDAYEVVHDEYFLAQDWQGTQYRNNRDYLQFLRVLDINDVTFPPCNHAKL